MANSDLIVDRSPFNEQVGYRLVEWSENRAAVELDVMAGHSNRRGMVHGGVLMTIIDAAGGYAGTYCPYPGRTRTCVTASLTTEFVRPAKQGDRLRAVAERRGGGNGIFVTTIEVHNREGHLVALGHGIYRYLKGSGAPDGIPGTDSTDGPVDD